jgi:hypothetical protein
MKLGSLTCLGSHHPRCAKGELMKKTLAGLTIMAALLGGFGSSAQAARRPSRPPAVNCTNASAQMAQLVAEGRALDEQRAQIRAAQAANRCGPEPSQCCGKRSKPRRSAVCSGNCRGDQAASQRTSSRRPVSGVQHLVRCLTIACVGTDWIPSQSVPIPA